MTSADVFRFLLIVGLGALAFITFLVAGTILGLMWLDAWACGTCRQFPVGLYILGLLGLLFTISIGYEMSDAPKPWRDWVEKNWMVLVVVLGIILTYFFVVNWWWI
jgi:hypothetical protein